MTFGSLPSTDSRDRPRFAYGDEIHEHCERRKHHDADRFARAWGDEGHRKGWCLEELGCKGPDTHHNCPTVKWNQGTCWPIGAGHPCIGCAEPSFWDRNAPFCSGESDH